MHACAMNELLKEVWMHDLWLASLFCNLIKVIDSDPGASLRSGIPANIGLK